MSPNVGFIEICDNTGIIGIYNPPEKLQVIEVIQEKIVKPIVESVADIIHQSDVTDIKPLFEANNIKDEEIGIGNPEQTLVRTKRKYTKKAKSAPIESLETTSEPIRTKRKYTKRAKPVLDESVEPISEPVRTKRKYERKPKVAQESISEITQPSVATERTATLILQSETSITKKVPDKVIRQMSTAPKLSDERKCNLV